jgi:hypothetical protein
LSAFTFENSTFKSELQKKSKSKINTCLVSAAQNASVTQLNNMTAYFLTEYLCKYNIGLGGWERGEDVCQYDNPN